MEAVPLRLSAFLLGLDETILRRLDDSARNALLPHAIGAAISYLVTAAATGAAADALGAAVPVMLLSGIIAAAFMWNLLRLLSAGSGIGLHLTEEESAKWRPSVLLPVGFLWLIAAILAQPAHMAFRQDELDQVVRTQRVYLARRHETRMLGGRLREANELSGEASQSRARLNKAQADLTDEAAPSQALLDDRRAELHARIESSRRALGATEIRLGQLQAEIIRIRSAEVDPYVRNLASSAFPVLCIATLWNEPDRAAAFTIVFALLITLPLLLRQTRPASLRPYEQLRRVFERELVVRSHQRADALSCAWLGLTRSESTARRFLDPPFNREPAPSIYESAARVTPEELSNEISRSGS